MKSTARPVWNACGYVRLSREDGDGGESNSVRGQKELIRDYLSRCPELRPCAMKVDDGYTGSNFERPAFREMMDEVRSGRINCIVVKDLSRFGRDHLGVGEYMERIFPLLGVRLIAINDRYDSLHSSEEADDLLIPFKNLVNESYCRDTSVKTRSQLEIKRQRGDFVGAFPVFGYRKDPADRHRLLADSFAADVVRDIFRWKLGGVSAGGIAGRLNERGIPTPMDYKRSQGLRFSTSFRVKEESAWSAGTVLRVLKNPIYTGVLEQGRVTTPSYRVRRRVEKPRSEWAVVSGCHEAIIDRRDFESVQRVLALDTRTGGGDGAVERFSGVVRCGECGGAMVRKTVPSGKRKYVYYVCAAHRERGTCFAHSLRAEALDEIVLRDLRHRVREMVGPAGLLRLAGEARLQRSGAGKTQARLAQKREEISRSRALLHSLYESLADGLLEPEEYRDLKKAYTRRCQEAEKQAQVLERELEAQTRAGGQAWTEALCRRGSIDGLDRTIVVLLVERVAVFRDRRVEIVYRWRDDLPGRAPEDSRGEGAL